MQIIDELIDRYKNIEREAIAGWKRSQEDKEIRTIVEFPGDEAKNRRSVRTETRAGNPRLPGPRPRRPGLHRQTAGPVQAGPGENRGRRGPRG